MNRLSNFNVNIYSYKRKSSTIKRTQFSCSNYVSRLLFKKTNIYSLRKKIEKIDQNLFKLFYKRMILVYKIINFKKRITDRKREEKLFYLMKKFFLKFKLIINFLDIENFIKDYYSFILKYSKKLQEEKLKNQ